MPVSELSIERQVILMVRIVNELVQFVDESLRSGTTSPTELMALAGRENLVQCWNVRIMSHCGNPLEYLAHCAASIRAFSYQRLPFNPWHGRREGR